MKRNEIKSIIKPIVKECITELLLQKEGILSNVVSEVVKGLQSPILESNNFDKNEQTEQDLSELEAKYELERQERIKRLNESVGGNFFKGTSPTPADNASQYDPLSGTGARDPGVDIKGIMAIAGRKWKKHTK
mgnify:CR=1 FL=1